MKYETGAAFFEEQSPEDVERFVEKNFDISEQVTHLLEMKGWTQRDLAEALGRSASEISRWLTGTHNLTLRSIARMEAALGADIILTPLKAARQVSKPRFIYIQTVVENRSDSFDQDVYSAEWRSHEVGRSVLSKVEAA